MARRFGSRSKRHVLFPRTDAPMPASEVRAGYDTPVLFRLNGDPTYAESYVTADGYTLADLVMDSWAPESFKTTIRTHRFRSKETMCNTMRRNNVYVYPVDDGVLSATHESLPTRYNQWKRGEVYSIGLMDDPSDDTGSTIFADSADSVDKGLLAVATRPIFGRREAERIGRVMGQKVSRKSSWRFRVSTFRPLEGLSADEAKAYGYDGSDMTVGERRIYGDFVIERMPDLDFTETRGNDDEYDVTRSGKLRKGWR